VPGVPRPKPALRRNLCRFFALLLGVCACRARAAHAQDCASAAGFSPCFDVNALWLPAGRASFLSMPDTRSTSPGQLGFGAAGELIHRPLELRVASPDRDGRDVQVVDDVVDLSYFASFGLLRNVEASLLTSIRAHQSGAGVGGIDSQSALPLARNAVRDPRVGLAYSLDEALARPGFGLRLALDATLPLGERDAFANERSFVVMPSATLGLRSEAWQLSAEFGMRLRRAVDFGSVVLGNQGFVALGAAVELIHPGWLTLSLEAFGLPALSDSRGRAASPLVSEARLFPAEWLAGVHSSFGNRSPWTVSLAAGGGIPLSSETRDTPSGRETSYFTGMTTPDFRSLLVMRYRAPDHH